MARQARHDRQEVLGKALELFWSKGYHATSLKDLELALDMRPGSIYAAFGSKEALFSETLALYAELSRMQFLETLGAAPSRLQGLANHVRRLGCAGEPGPSRACMLVKTLLETPDDDPRLRVQTEALMRGMEAMFARAFREAQEQGEIGPEADPQQLASRLQVEIFGLRAYAQRTDSRVRVAQLAEEIARGLEARALA
ncbi:TetR/AcrR family transcriptional regulator [Yangia mangrovi]|uniref:TetR family transcriptional regulator n=1 Tax=Alloyangia mangrovi TaxID=1779329 RepID=A0A2A3JSD3_9RHOB|nr:TetR/AcrR family transcriptional regulator [Alloyangia mangrovi]MCA0939262.1 TetR/AcrR family transcriptional regulator [Alloyangia pacifica]MCA0943688.1 TetR/AcrR family transcriptional regulator [Alloyangia pacifica]MCT4372940.1 TetR/AcrR family transcriptional regulator [Alloyangia mangrovi]